MNYSSMPNSTLAISLYLSSMYNILFSRLWVYTFLWIVHSLVAKKLAIYIFNTSPASVAALIQHFKDLLQSIITIFQYQTYKYIQICKSGMNFKNPQRPCTLSSQRNVKNYKIANFFVHTNTSYTLMESFPRSKVNRVSNISSQNRA